LDYTNPATKLQIYFERLMVKHGDHKNIYQINKKEKRVSPFHQELLFTYPKHPN
jgi:hypothetical protein